MANNHLNGMRETFGIVDSKTGELYPDLISYSIVKAQFSQMRLFTRTFNFYEEANNPKGIIGGSGVYWLHMDSNLKRALKQLARPTDTIDVIISLQTRTTGKIALARILKKEGE